MAFVPFTLFGESECMKREVHIFSYFSLPTDLAAEMRGWPEFVAGQDYSVELKNPSSGESVSVRYIEEGEERYVSVAGSGNGSLFDKVLGCVIYTLAGHSDNLMVDSHE
jgi:hypothetical protein